MTILKRRSISLPLVIQAAYSTDFTGPSGMALSETGYFKAGSRFLIAEAEIVTSFNASTSLLRVGSTLNGSNYAINLDLKAAVGTIYRFTPLTNSALGLVSDTTLFARAVETGASTAGSVQFRFHAYYR